MKAVELFRQKLVLNHSDGIRIGIFEMVIWKVPVSPGYPKGIKFRAWLSEAGKTIFGFDNHKPKGPHLHLGEHEVKYDFRNLNALRDDVIAMIRKEGFIYEN